MPDTHANVRFPVLDQVRLDAGRVKLPLTIIAFVDAENVIACVNPEMEKLLTTIGPEAVTVNGAPMAELALNTTLSIPYTGISPADAPPEVADQFVVFGDTIEVALSGSLQ